MNIKITKQSSGVRLDKFIVSAGSIWKGKQLSRGQIQKLIKQNIIEVNGRPASPHYGLRPGDLISFKEYLLAAGRPVKKIKAAAGNQPKIEIIAETDDFLIINKPAGLAVHGTADRTLADWLKIKYPGIELVGDSRERPGIVHRLDKDVSGLMIIAKNQAAFNRLKKQFQDRTVTKEYTALVHGRIQKDSGAINFPIKRSRDGYKMAAIPFTAKGRPTENGRPALTEFRIIDRLINYALLKIKIKTGRTHQIRVHLAAYGHPLVGDNIYATAKTRNQNKKLGLNRVFLVADRLGLNDLNNNKQDYKIDLPEELKSILKIVK